jgi:hypothetical protein
MAVHGESTTTPPDEARATARLLAIAASVVALSARFAKAHLKTVIR